MKKGLAILIGMSAVTAFAQSHYRQAYVTKNGTYVAPSYATNPNNTLLDNYSTKGNVNPYTGKAGTVDPYKIQPAPTYRHYTPTYAPQPVQRPLYPSLADNDDD